MTFTPIFCPHGRAQCSLQGAFTFHRKGSFTRKCDGQRVPRFVCMACRRYFSEQTFRLDYGLKRPELDLKILGELVSLLPQRGTARKLGCNRKSVATRVRRLGDFCRTAAG